MANDIEDEPITLALTGAGAALSAGGAVGQNQQIAKAARINQNQVGRQGQQQRTALGREVSAYLSTLRAVNAEQGTGQGGSYRAAVTTAYGSADESVQNIKRNTINAQRSIAENANNQMVSPVIAGIQGGLQGLAFGTQLNNLLTAPWTPGVGVDLDFSKIIPSGQGINLPVGYGGF